MTAADERHAMQGATGDADVGMARSDAVFGRVLPRAVWAWCGPLPTNLADTPEVAEQWVIGAAITGATQKIVNAQLAWIFGMQLYEAALERHISPRVFAYPLTVATNGEGLNILKSYTVEQLEVAAWNQLLAAVAISAIATDEALDETLGQKTNATLEGATELDAARVVIAQIRNAFAHEPLRPTWACTAGYHRQYAVASINVTWNGGLVHDQQFKAEDFGGWKAYARLMRFAQEAVTAPGAGEVHSFKRE